MSGGETSVRPATPEDYDDWLGMWRGYCAFYEEDPISAVTETTWRRIHDANEPVHCLIAEDGGGNAVGFANYLTHDSTSDVEPVCYLQDLFVNPEARRGGIGRLLIEYLIGIVRDNGWCKLYWHTKENNHVARILYDRIASDCRFVRYRVEI